MAVSQDRTPGRTAAPDQPGRAHEVGNADQRAREVGVFRLPADPLAMGDGDGRHVPAFAQHHRGHEAVDMVEPRQVEVGRATERAHAATQILHPVAQKRPPDDVRRRRGKAAGGRIPPAAALALHQTQPAGIRARRTGPAAAESDRADSARPRPA